jgi:hypothetical protein
MTQFGQHSKPANGKRLQGLEAVELPPNNEDLDAIAQRRDERHSDEILLAELSKLNALDYGKRRKAAAKKLEITTATLDKIVAERRVRRSAQTGPETLLPHWDVEPWHEPVASDQLLGAIVERIRAHVVMN